MGCMSGCGCALHLPRGAKGATGATGATGTGGPTGATGATGPFQMWSGMIAAGSTQGVVIGPANGGYVAGSGTDPVVYVVLAPRTLGSANLFVFDDPEPGASLRVSMFKRIGGAGAPVLMYEFTAVSSGSNSLNAAQTLAVDDTYFVTAELLTATAPLANGIRFSFTVV